MTADRKNTIEIGFKRNGVLWPIVTAELPDLWVGFAYEPGPVEMFLAYQGQVFQDNRGRPPEGDGTTTPQTVACEQDASGFGPGQPCNQRKVTFTVVFSLGQSNAPSVGIDATVTPPQVVRDE